MSSNATFSSSILFHFSFAASQIIFDHSLCLMHNILLLDKSTVWLMQTRISGKLIKKEKITPKRFKNHFAIKNVQRFTSGIRRALKICEQCYSRHAMNRPIWKSINLLEKPVNTSYHGWFVLRLIASRL